MNKKRKAAIGAVMQYLKQVSDQKDTAKSNWALVGRRIIMQNRIMVQRRDFQKFGGK
jgi:hypothetical protein